MRKPQAIEGTPLAGTVLPLGDFGTLGASITSLTMDEMAVRTVERPEGTGELFNASDLALALTYSRRLTDRFSIGFTAKYISQRIWHESASGFALDVGTLFVTSFRGLRIGASLYNFGADIRFEPPAPDLWRFGLPENEAVPLALVINELGTNAIKHRANRSDAVGVRVTAKPDGMEFAIENSGQLKDGFNLNEIAASVSGLGLVKALLPRRGARLTIDSAGTGVMAKLHLYSPAVRE